MAIAIVFLMFATVAVTACIVAVSRESSRSVPVAVWILLTLTVASILVSLAILVLGNVLAPAGGGMTRAIWLVVFSELSLCLGLLLALTRRAREHAGMSGREEGRVEDERKVPVEIGDGG